MEAEFWHQMWDTGKVGFHQDEINPYLTEYWQNLNLTGKEAVFVPLCGKSMDMLWLKSLGHFVMGIELSQKAFEEFVAENNLRAQPLSYRVFCGYELDSMTLLCGDFFDLKPMDCQKVAAVYDRAALVALPPVMRQDYVDHLRAILPSGHQILLVVMSYDPLKMDGPPFSVSGQEITQLYGGHYQIKKLADFQLQRKGHPVIESVYHLRHLG